MALVDLPIRHSLQLSSSDIAKIKCELLHFSAYLSLYTATIRPRNKTSGIGIDVPQATAPAMGRTVIGVMYGACGSSKEDRGTAHALWNQTVAVGDPCRVRVGSWR